MSKNGTKVLVKLGASAIAGQMGSSFDAAYDMIETTTKQSPGRSKTYETGENGGTFSVETLIADTEGAALVALYAAAKAGTPQAFIITSEVIGDVAISGNALISGISQGLPKNDVRTLSFNFQISGEFTAAVIAA